MSARRIIALPARRMFVAALVLASLSHGMASAAPRTPAVADEVLTELPAGARHASDPARAAASSRLDVALPLAQLDIARARETGDLRFLGYAEAVLDPWVRRADPAPAVMVLHATILQSRHAFAASLAELDRVTSAHPEEAQAWLVRATVLRVLGRYDEALASCRGLVPPADSAVATLCEQGIRGLTGGLDDAYRTVKELPSEQLAPQIRAWRESELGEMAERLGQDEIAERHFRRGLEDSPRDFYMRLAYADLLLRHGRAAETLRLLESYPGMEPMMLRAAIAHRQLQDGASAESESRLAGAFDVEERRGESVHRREQARFLLDIRHEPAAALAAALQNWQVQREPEDLLILARAAKAAGRPEAARPAREFIDAHHFEDARLRGNVS